MHLGGCRRLRRYNSLGVQASERGNRHGRRQEHGGTRVWHEAWSREVEELGRVQEHGRVQEPWMVQGPGRGGAGTGLGRGSSLGGDMRVKGGRGLRGCNN